MASLYTHRDANIRRTLLLFTVFLIVVIGVGWVFAEAYGNPAILYIAIAISVVMNVVAYWNSDKLVIRMSRAVPAPREQYPELHRVVENLCIAAGLPVPKIYIVDDAAPNAFATGRNPQHAAVAVTTGLLAILNRAELEGVLAHELSHIGNRDTLISTAAVVLAGFIAMLSDIFLRSLWWGGGRRNRDGEGYLFIAAIAAAILAPLAASLLRLAISRKREFLADASGALLTRYPEGLAAALEKIAAAPRGLKVARNATAHLWFASPFRADRKHARVSWLVKLFMTHPPIEERIRALRGMEIQR